MTKEFPFETKILLLLDSYLQKIFFGYWIAQDPRSIFPLIFCSNIKSKLLVFFKFLIIFFFISALVLNDKIQKKKNIKISKH